MISAIVGIASIFLFRERIIESASLLLLSLNSTRISDFIGSATVQLPIPGEHLLASNMSVPRAIRKAFLAVETSEGVGARGKTIPFNPRPFRAFC